MERKIKNTIRKNILKEEEKKKKNPMAHRYGEGVFRSYIENKLEEEIPPKVVHDRLLFDLIIDLRKGEISEDEFEKFYNIMFNHAYENNYLVDFFIYGEQSTANIGKDAQEQYVQNLMDKGIWFSPARLKNQADIENVVYSKNYLKTMFSKGMFNDIEDAKRIKKAGYLGDDISLKELKKWFKDK